MPARKNSRTAAALDELRAFGLAYPGAHLKSPWPDHKDLAVNDKTFAYLSNSADEPFGISCKLPESSDVALSLPFVEPAGYGLGKSGWVAATVPDGEEIPIDLFKAWLDESYRAQAPKKLVAQLGGGKGGISGSKVAGARPGKKKAPAKKRAAPAKKKTAKKR
jgi:predicted DNA-binding protein (MmcQ/YjbR family)